MERILGPMDKASLEPKIFNEAHGEIVEQYLSGDALRTQLGWVPGTSLDEGIQQSIAWSREFLGTPKLAHV